MTSSSFGLNSGTEKLREIRKITDKYRGSSWVKALSQLANTLVPLGVLYWVVFNYFLKIPLLWVPCAFLAAGLIVRAFMLQHDCAHHSFFRSKIANNVVGAVLGVLTLTPHACWRRNHLLHHAGTGNLDKRGVGDIRTLTKAEYGAASWLKRVQYRIYRHPMVLFGVGAFLFFAVWQRFTHFLPSDWWRERLSVHATNMALIAILATLISLGGSWSILLIFHCLAMLFATAIGVWFFYIQHQFPEAYWETSVEWRFLGSALHGASFYDLHPVFHWFTAYIGYHHIHHLDTRIPNYRLSECHKRENLLRPTVRFGLLESLAFSKLRLWDAENKRMIPFDDRTAHSYQGFRGDGK